MHSTLLADKIRLAVMRKFARAVRTGDGVLADVLKATYPVLAGDLADIERLVNAKWTMGR